LEDVVCSNKEGGPFWGPKRGKISKIWYNFIKLLLMNH